MTADFYAAVTIVALSTAAGMFLADRAYVACRWWRALAAAERAEQQQPDAGLSLVDAPAPRFHKRRRKSFAQHADEALDVFNDEAQDAHDELLVAVQELQQTDPADLWSVYQREVPQ